jgi:rhodanese-related sulfurtransferase
VNNLKKIKPNQLHQMIKENKKPQLIDVREPAEFESEHVKESILVPLSKLEKEASRIDKNQPAYFICRTGQRSCQAVRTLETLGCKDIVVLDGGLEEWRKAGLPTILGTRRVWAMDRQVRLTAGLFVLVGIIFSWLIHPAFIGISLFVASGLIYSAITDSCGMAMMLAKMPWNKSKQVCVVSSEGK